jgi:predicted alpha/beta superfamily hydrolase
MSSSPIRRLVCALALTLAAAPLAHGADDDLVIGRRFTLRSKVLGEERAYWVHLPPGYEGGRAHYPVLYMTDAEAQFAHTAATVDFLARNARVPPLIVVAVGNTDRTRDLTPTRGKLPQPDGTLLELPTAGGADRFLDFLEQELIPHVERTWRTVNWRAFAGHSFGGLFGVHAFTSRPQLFGAVLAVSPTLTWDDRFPVRRVREFFKDRATLNRTLVVTLGREGEGLQAAFEELQAVLAGAQAKGFEWAARRFPEDDHGSLVLPSHDFGLRRIFAEWRPPQDPTTGEVRASVDELDRHYARVSERFGVTVRAPENVVNLMGYAALGRRQFEQALAYFEYNRRNHPDSANVHDSLGEGLEAAGRLDQARTSYEKAVELGAQAKDLNLPVYRQHLDAVRKKLASPAP